MKKIFTKELIIGICVISAIAILIIGIEFLKGINLFKPANFYVARYDNVQGLESAAPVLIDGFKVGQVREINFDYEHPGKIEVVMALNKNLHVPVDSKAIIGSTLLSGAYIEIKLGQSSDMLAIGGEIPTSTVPDLLASLSNDIMPSINSILPRVDSLLMSLNDLAGDPSLARSIRNVEAITESVYVSAGGLNQMIGNIDSRVPGILGNVNQVALNLDSMTNNLNDLSMELKRLPISTTMENVNDVSGNLIKFSNQLNDPNSSLGLLTRDPELYNRINRVAADVDSLIVDIQKNPKRYISIKLF